ncbi:MAG: MMPL family transporter [Rhizobiaceae bacterium]
MSSIGFGFERIGLWTQRHPILLTVFVVIVTALAGINVPKVRFDGNVTAVLPEDSEAFRNYFDQRDSFRDFSRDVTILVQSERLMTADGLEDLRNLQLEIAISDVVENVVTIFSTPDPDPDTGEIGQFFPESFDNDAQARTSVEALLEKFPQARSLISPSKGVAILLVTLDASLTGDDAKVYRSFQDLKQATEDAAPQDFDIHYTGLTPIGLTIVGALVSDQLKLTLVGLALGTGIAFYIFRSLLAALVCAFPPALTAVWSLGMVGWYDIPINYLTTVLPTLALILAFADGIVLYYRWQVSNSHSSDLDANLTEALQRVGPASSLTSITTVLAFLSFSFASGTALKTFSMLGMGVVAIAFLAVIIGLPLVIHWAIRLGLARPERLSKPAFSQLGAKFMQFVRPRPAVIALCAIAVVAMLSVVHGIIRAEYRITDYLPATSGTRTAEELANEVIGGRSLIFLSVPVAQKGSAFLAPNLERLKIAEEAAGTVFEQGRVFSLTDITRNLNNETAIAKLAETIETERPQAKASFISGDGSRMLVSIRIPSDQSINKTLTEIDALRAALNQLEFGKDVIITGFDVLMAREFTSLISQLRTSLLLAIFLGVVIVGIATRSPLLALAALTPNLLPVLTVELAVWIKGGSINLSEVIALTIAFGIAIDNAVHVINVFSSERRSGKSVREALDETLAEVGPALGASTMIICVACLVTQISILPVVPVLGRLMIATLIVALVSNLAILPANILILDWLATKFRRKAPAGERVSERA